MAECLRNLDNNFKRDCLNLLPRYMYAQVIVIYF